MDPTILMSILGVAQEAGKSVAANSPYLFETQSEQSNLDKLNALKKRELKGSLGLTPDEYQRIIGLQQGAVENDLQRSRQQAQQYQANNIGSPEALKATALQGAQAAGVRQGINSKLEDMNQTAIKEQKSELEARQAADSEAKARRLQAWLGVLSGTSSAAMDTTMFNQKTSGSLGKEANPTTEDLATHFSNSYGISQEDAQALADSSSDDQELASVATKLLGGK